MVATTLRCACRGHLQSRPRDVSFVLSDLLARNQMAGDLIDRLINPPQVAASGWSPGGYAAMTLAAGEDSVCDTLIPWEHFMNKTPLWTCVPSPREPGSQNCSPRSPHLSFRIPCVCPCHHGGRPRPHAYWAFVPGQRNFVHDPPPSDLGYSPRLLPPLPTVRKGRPGVAEPDHTAAGMKPGNQDNCSNLTCYGILTARSLGFPHARVCQLASARCPDKSGVFSYPRPHVSRLY